MRLYVGKNHDEKDASVSVQSIFRLAGKNEDALTYALGFLLARDPELCAKLVRLCGVKPARSFKSEYAVHLQEITDRTFGRRDIVIEAGESRIVIEAKIGKAEPTAKQLLKYAKDSAKWKKFATGMVVSLTQVKLSPAVQEEVVSKLPHKPKVGFKAIQWHQVIDLVLRHGPSDGSEVSQYLFDEFIRYIRRDYDMGYYDAEIKIQDTNPENAKVFQEGWLQLTSYRIKSPLYVAPYFTGKNVGISMISRVVGAETVDLTEIPDTFEWVTREQVTEEQQQHWSDGWRMLRKLYPPSLQYVLFLDKPFQFRSSPLIKSAFNATEPDKQIPQQIPQGFSLRFDELLKAS